MKHHDDFLLQLKNFENESSAAARFMYAEMAIQHAASKSKKLLNRLNNTPTFWIACGASLQSSAYITIARIFDKKSKYNIDKLLDSMEQNLNVFQRDALATRKRDGRTEDPDWLEGYLESAYFPKKSDVVRLRKMVKKYRELYNRAIMPVRHNYLAHRAIVDQEKIQKLYANGTIRELWRLSTFLLQLNNVLWEQYHNGRKPVFRSLRHSVKSIYDAKHQRSSPNELIVSDVKKLMQFIEFATLDHT